ncbi:GNAT family N-acetyltransferase [Spongiimicrobium sp. 2-473A-2-J]|uniref:GNAT family N-acetyltransferase n=1 Tax=Eudoraea algarum TaxID=3417568 RepID=UPI003D35B755
MALLLRKHLVIDFLNVFLERRDLAPLFKKVGNTLVNRTIFERPLEYEGTPGEKTLLIFDVPSYLKATPGLGPDTKTYIANAYKGSTIHLANYLDLEDYLKKRFSAKRRAQLASYERRIQTSFNITGRFFYGPMEKETFERLFDAFYHMLDRRFQEKATQNEDIPHWDKYREMAYPLIQDKKACLSVIYDDQRPISMSLNLIHDKIIFGYMKSHDTDYSKFSLGFLDLKNMLQWCFDNGFEVFDFLKGEYSYKSKWTDGEYYFQRYIVCPSASLSKRLYARVLYLKIRGFYSLVRFLKRVKIHLIYHRYKALKYRLTHNSTTAYDNSIQVAVAKEVPPPESRITVPWERQEFSFLRKPVYDFLYTYKEHRRHIEVIRTPNVDNSYLVLGKNGAQRLTFDRAFNTKQKNG